MEIQIQEILLTADREVRLSLNLLGLVSIHFIHAKCIYVINLWFIGSHLSKIADYNFIYRCP